MQITTRLIDGELWLHDASRRLTAEEVAAMRAAVDAAQQAHAWEQAASAATDLGPLIAPRWNAATQQYEVWQVDGARRVPAVVLDFHRSRILGSPAPSLFSLGPA